MPRFAPTSEPHLPPPSGALQQSPLYHAALRRMGVDAYRVPLSGPDVWMVRRRFPLLGAVGLLSRAPLGAAADLGRLRRDLGLDALIVNAATPADGAALDRAGFWRLAAPRGVVMLPLTGGPAGWLGRMDGKWRNRLRHAQRQPLSITVEDFAPDAAHWLLRADSDQQRARGYRNLSPTLIAAMAATPGAMTLVAARTDDAPIAAMLFARHGPTASYLVGWSNAQGRAMSAHNVILWQAMGHLAGRGVAVIDLGVYTPGRGAGLVRFKTGAGGQWHALGGTWLDARLSAPLHARKRRLRATPPPPAAAAPAPGARPGFPTR